MEWHDYREWVRWPVEEISRYACEIAFSQCLTRKQAKYLVAQMKQQTGRWPERTAPFDPSALRAHMGKYQLVSRGSGLTARSWRQTVREPRYWFKLIKRQEKSRAQVPFSAMSRDIAQCADDALWASNCYPIEHDNWLNPQGNDAPYEGLVWYASQLELAYDNARKQAELGNSEGSLWHAFRAGELYGELRIRLAHSEAFDKAEAVRTAQSDAGRSRKTVSDEVRKETYWTYRNCGNKRVEAGRLAAADLGLSETSIRNAFPGHKYPAD